MAYRTILGEEAKSLGRQAKWDLLSPFIRQHGREALSYATLQAGMIYQFRAWSFRVDAGDVRNYISSTEDLKGVFRYVPAN